MAKYIHWRWFCRTAKSNGKDLFWSNTQNHSILWWCRTENCPRFIACEVLPYYQKSRNWWLISTRDPLQCISLFFHYTPFSHDWLRYWKGLDWLWVHIFEHSLFLCSTVKVYRTEGSYFEFKDSIYGLSCLCSFILVVFAVKMINKLKKLKCKSRAYCVHTKLIVPGLNCLIWNMNSKLEIYRQMQPECSTIYHCVGLHCHRKSYNGVLDLYKSVNPWWNNLPTHYPFKGRSNTLSTVYQI